MAPKAAELRRLKAAKSIPRKKLPVLSKTKTKTKAVIKGAAKQKRSKKKGKESYRIYIYNVLKQVWFSTLWRFFNSVRAVLSVFSGDM